MAKAIQFDDRVDTETELTTGQTLALIGRSIGFLRSVRGLFFWKFIFAIVSVLPPLLTPWILKIIVDQVILGQPFGTTEVRAPVFLTPFINAIQDFTPGGIMLAVTALFAVLLIIFGFRVPPAEHVAGEGMPMEYDSATQS
jgi:ABC-type multidrug transport system fused ATPase/permease subunit